MRDTKKPRRCTHRARAPIGSASASVRGRGADLLISFNPARSIATAVFGGGEALGQVWASIVAPIAGAVIAAFVYRAVFERPALVAGAANPEVSVPA